MSTTIADHLRNACDGTPQDAADVLAALCDSDGGYDAQRCGELLVRGRDGAEALLVEALDLPPTVAGAVIDALLAAEVRLTGAEACAALLAAADVETVFVYAGTSELALCDATERAHGVTLVNGRGDKESAFMAAGASLLRPNRGAAVLHGARGLTNAAGGVADARRNEAGTMYIVGLPSSSSERFLPPHGENELFGGMGTFADWCWQSPGIPDDPGRRRQAARRFVGQFRDGLASAAQPPCRPSVFGIPQDVSESRWIALDELAVPAPEPRPVDLAQPSFETALRALRAAARPVLLVDDYALRYPGIRAAVDALTRAVGAPVLQLRYRRGPMMFERIRTDEVANFVGWLNQFSSAHTELLDSTDLLITVEDRNVYERVAGRLPDCAKIAINTDPEKVLKNEYLGEDDALIVGDPAVVLAELVRRLQEDGISGAQPWFPAAAAAGASVTPEPADPDVEHARRGITGALGELLADWAHPVLVDDSQMFGGLLSEGYDDLPRGLRVFGGHGGFVGGGLPYATGLAIADPEVRVMCTLGDQAFTNSLQGLVAAIQQQARVMFVVCNNGESVSLKKQARASYGQSSRSYLSNVQGLSYYQLAASLGIPSCRVEVPVGAGVEHVEPAMTEFRDCLAQAARATGPSLVELVLPADPEAWRGIWLTQGFEQAQAVMVR